MGLFLVFAKSSVNYLMALLAEVWRKYSGRYLNAFLCYVEIETSAHFFLAEVKIPQGTRSLNRWALTWLFRGVSFHFASWVCKSWFRGGVIQLKSCINPHVLPLFLLLVGSISLFESY